MPGINERVRRNGSLHRRSAVALALALLAVAPAKSLEQQLPVSDAPAGFVAMGDMFVAEELVAASHRGISPQGAVIFRPEQPNPPSWPYGIVPIKFGPEVSAERQQLVWSACELWRQPGSIVCIPHTVQATHLLVRASGSTGCGAHVGAYRPSLMNFSLDWCWNLASVTHDFGHLLGFIHEHQRPDRDTYVSVDMSNVRAGFEGAYVIWGAPVTSTGPYDFDSLMHYPAAGYNIDPSKPIIVPRPEFAEAARRMGAATRPSPTDLAAADSFYRTQLRPYGANRATGPVQTHFDRTEFLGALDQLHAIYISTLGLNRPNGLSLGGRPDFLGIATWIFDIYLGARSAGFDPVSAFDIVVAAITQTDEWKVKHPGGLSLVPAPFTPYIHFDRDEFLNTLTRLDAFYGSREGLQRPNGLSLNGTPDFPGIATWIFDVYLNQRLTGGSPNAAWIAVENAIKETDEWKSKH